MRIVALVSESFGGHGGIAQYCRDLLDGLAQDPSTKSITVFPRLVGSATGTVPEKIDYRTEAAGGIVSYIRELTRFVLSPGSCDLILCGHINLLPFADLLRLRFGAPVLLFIYGIDAWQPTRRWNIGRVDGVAAISRYTAERFTAWSDVPAERIHILPNAIHLERYGVGGRPSYLVVRHGLDGCRVLLTLGRICAEERYKGFDEVIELMPELVAHDPSLRYLVVGDGNDRERLQRKCIELGVQDYVIFAGRIDEAEKADYYRLADAFTMVGYGEGFGFVFLEAMACGIPVVASQLDGSRDAVLDGQIGLLADPRNRATLRDTLLQALAKRREVPDGLHYFAFPNFCKSLGKIVAAVTNPSCQRR